MSIFLVLDSAIGSGKTYAIAGHAGFGANSGDRFLIAVPSIRMVRQTHDGILRRFPHTRVTAIDSSNTPNVGEALKAATEEAEGGCVVICTHAGFLMSPWIGQRETWNLIVDEMPDTVWTTKLISGKNNDLISRAFRIRNSDGKYAVLDGNDVALLDRIAADHSLHGVYSRSLQDTARKLTSGWWSMWVLERQWAKAISTGRSELLVFGALGPTMFDGFASVTFASANCEHTLAQLHLKAVGCEFVPHNALRAKLRYRQYPHGDRISIYYAVDDLWSKRLRDQKINIGGSRYAVNDIIAAGALELFSNEPFGKLLNLDRQKDNDPFGEAGVILPHKSHGLNSYQHLHNAVIIPALNPAPAFTAFLRDKFGLEERAVYRAIYLESVLQASGRISIRNLVDATPKRLVVADRVAADFLGEMYPGASREVMPYAEHIANLKPTRRGRPQTRSAMEKAEQERLRDRRKVWRCKHAKLVTRNTYISYGVLCDKLLSSKPSGSIQSEPDKFVGFACSFWDSRAVTWREYDLWEPQPYRHLRAQRLYTADEFEALLHDELSTRQSVSKQQNDLVMPSLVDLNLDKRHGHAKSNHVVSAGVILDFDSSELTPEEVHRALPYRMIVYSSWSYSPDKLRYRVCIPTALMSYDAQEAMRRMCVRRLEEFYPGKAHTIDMNKMTPVALFYLPSCREHRLFHSFGGPHLDHVEWVRQCPPDIADKCIELSPHTPKEKKKPTAEPTPITCSPARNSSNTDRAIANWHARGLTDGNSRKGFFKLAMDLVQYTSLEPHDIRQVLWEQAGHCHNPSGRRGEIESNLEKALAKHRV